MKLCQTCPEFQHRKSTAFEQPILDHVIALNTACKPPLTHSLILLVSLAQGLVGYVQYFTGVPALLVGFHIAGATAVWVAVLRLHLAFSVPVAGTGEESDGGSVEPWSVALTST